MVVKKLYLLRSIGWLVVILGVRSVLRSGRRLMRG
jgi:hypothetical protein